VEAKLDELAATEAPDKSPRQLDISHAQQVAALFESEYPRVVHCMVRKTGSWAEARECVSGAFAQVLERCKPGSVNFLKAYVYRTATNFNTDRVRLQAGRQRIIRIARHEFPSTTPPPETAMLQEQRLQILERAMQTLRPTFRQLLVWRMWEELPYAEIELRFAAEGTDVGERTLLRWCAQALAELRWAILAAEGATEDEKGRERRTARVRR